MRSEATMASLELRSDRFRIVFRVGGKKLHASLKTTDQREAEGCLARLEENLRLMERGRLVPPPDADIPTFLLSDGKIAEKLHLPDQALTLEAVIRRYVDVHSNGAMEENSLQTVEMHLRHFTESLGATFAINRLKQDNLQAHIDRRAKKKGIHKRKLSPVTLRKELASFRALWNWSVKSGLLAGPFPNQGLVFPKTEEKPPFQTWEEIERQVSRGGMAPADEKALWDSLFLTVPQIHEILEHVRSQKLQPFVYPMFCFAAHTGARRSEMLRCRVTDVDFEGKKILIREKKRGRGCRTTRHVPLSPFSLRSCGSGSPVIRAAWRFSANNSSSPGARPNESIHRSPPGMKCMTISTVRCKAASGQSSAAGTSSGTPSHPTAPPVASING
jgi:site-specific recombinase XerD